MEFVNQREIMVNALQRSGHHAFIDWLLLNCPKHLFLNCPRQDKFFRRGFIIGNPEARFLNDLNLSLDREMSGDLTPKELLVYNAENSSTEEALRIFNSEHKLASIGRSKAQFFVVWLRDPFNNFASLCKRARRLLRHSPDSSWYREGVEKLNLCCDLWVDHFEAYRAAADGRSGLVPLVYNRWLADPAVRSELADRFGIGSQRDVVHTVKWGGGSSFSDYFEGQAAPTSKELENRWQAVKDLPFFRELFRRERFRAAVLAFRDHYSSPELDLAYAELVR